MITIYIVEDHGLIIEGIVSLLDRYPEMKICGYSNTAAGCIEFFKFNSADVVLMDINLPDMSGIDLCKQIKETNPGIMVLGLSTYNQGVYINKMIENGASGYLLKNAERSEIIRALQEVSKGRNYLSIEASKSLRSDRIRNQQLPVLTRREKEILLLITEGYTNQEISLRLFISVDTVDSHRKNVYSKLGVRNTAQLVKYAIRNNLI